MLADVARWIDKNLPYVMDLFGTTARQCKRESMFAKAQDLIRSGADALRGVAFDAVATKQGGVLRRIQEEITTLPPVVHEPLRVLVVMAVGDVHNKVQVSNLKTWLTVMDDYDFYIYSYAHETHNDLAEYRRELRPFPNVAKLHPKVKSGCKLAFWVDAIETSRTSKKQYTHVWFVDNDLDLRHFHKPAWEALVRHSAPLVCQPGILPRSRGDRGSDHFLCEAQFSADARRASNFYSFAYDFRGRRLRDPHDVSKNSIAWQVGGIEVMCPLVDCRIVDAFCKIVKTFDHRSDWACERVFNQLASEFAGYSAAQNVPRVSKLVFDFVPLIHMDTRTIGKKSACLRADMDSVRIKQVCSLLAQTQDSCHLLAWVSQNHKCRVTSLPPQRRAAP